MRATSLSPLHRRRAGILGFSLIELMVTVAIVAILASIALPAYLSSVRKSRRTEAKAALLDLAGREERYYNTNNNVYTNLANALGYGTAAVTTLTVGSGYYQVTISSPAANGVPAPSYEIVAVPITPDQLKDAQCLQFTVDSTGLQTATNAVCWQ
jgi:type IV pilus assembly protein PilE